MHIECSIYLCNTYVLGPSKKNLNNYYSLGDLTRVYFARDYIFSMVPTKYFAHIPAKFFEFNVFVFEL